MDKGINPPFPKKANLGIASNYLTSIAAKIYNAFQSNHIKPKIEKILIKNQNSFRRNRSSTSQILTKCRILEGVCAKNLEATILFVDFSKAFDSIYRGEMEQILRPPQRNRRSLKTKLLTKYSLKKSYMYEVHTISF